MVYSEMVKKACLIAFDAHAEDVDKGGYPYVMHPLALAFQMESEDAVCAALLHDVIEDHADKYCLEDFAKAGFSSAVLDALKLLTHDPAVPYLDYVKEIGKNEIARQVKIADITHNLDSSRLDGRGTPKDGLYREALCYLLSLKKEGQ